MAVNDADRTLIPVAHNDTDAAGTIDGDEVNRRFRNELDLVAIIAGQVSRSIDNCVDFDELLAAGREGLFDAARRFDPKRGIQFRTYANYRVEGAIIDTVRRSMHLPRRAYERLLALEASSRITQGDVDYALIDGNPEFWDRDTDQYIVDQLAMIATSAAASVQSQRDLNSIADDTAHSNPEDAYEHAEIMSLIREAFMELDGQERRTIELCYFEGLSFSEMAETMNISKAWAHRIHTRAMDRLTKRIRFASA